MNHFPNGAMIPGSSNTNSSITSISKIENLIVHKINGTDLSNGSLVTHTNDGFMSSTDKIKLDSIDGSGSGSQVDGTTNRITVIDNVVDIASNYSGQSSITIVGTLTSGSLGSGFGIIPSNLGGTGINNNGSTITLGGNLTTSGAFNTTLTTTGPTNVTLPTSGTLATVDQIPEIPTIPDQLIGTANRITVSSGTINLATNYVGQNTITTVGNLSSGSLSTGFTPVTPELGGTGITNYVTGDLLVGNGSGLTKLSGNTSTSKRFLTQTGTGTVSEIPAWNGIDSTDVSGTALTTGNDTNVTLTLGGTPETSLLRAASITAGWTGVLSSARGGTGVNNASRTITLGGNLVTSGAHNTTLTTTGNTNVTLPVSGTLATVAQIPTIPAQLTGTSNRITVSDGTIDVASGYVGQSTITTVGNLSSGSLSTGFTPVTPSLGGTGITSYSIGELLVGNGSNALTKLSGNTTTSKRFLTQTGTGTVSASPVWNSIDSTDVSGTALTASNDTNVTLTLGGTPETSLLRATSITAGWTGTLSPARGGTGVNNASRTITLGGNLVTSGAHNTTLTTTGTTNVTLPVSGTLATVDQIPTIPAIPDVLGTTNRINVTDDGSGNKVVDLATNYTGQNTITTVGNLSSGSLGTGFTPVTPELGGTGITNYVTGDLLVGNESGLTKLSGNTSTSKRFLTQTGTGTVSEIPAWNGIDSTDVSGTALTASNDTNVTLTLGGTPETSLLRAASITAGWTGVLSSTRGGTGVNNGTRTITLGGNLVTSGAHNTTFTTTGNTNVTLPVSGTLATVDQIPVPTPPVVKDFIDIVLFDDREIVRQPLPVFADSGVITVTNWHYAISNPNGECKYNNSGLEVDSVTGLVTILKSGSYSISTSVHFRGSEGAFRFSCIQITDNDNITKNFAVNYNSGDGGPNVGGKFWSSTSSMVMYLEAGDMVGVGMAHQFTSAVNIRPDVVNFPFQFSIHEL